MKIKMTLWVFVAGIGLLWTANMSEAASKTTNHVVAMVKDCKGDVTYEVMPQKDFAGRKKEVMAQYKDALTEWMKARQEARKNKDAFKEKKPVRPLVIRKGPLFKTEEKAKTYADKLTQKRDAAKKKSEEKKSEKKEPKEKDE